MASNFEIDAVIDPVETRKWIMTGMWFVTSARTASRQEAPVYRHLVIAPLQCRSTSMVHEVAGEFEFHSLRTRVLDAENIPAILPITARVRGFAKQKSLGDTSAGAGIGPFYEILSVSIFRKGLWPGAAYAAVHDELSSAKILRQSCSACHEAVLVVKPVQDGVSHNLG